MTTAKEKEKKKKRTGGALEREINERTPSSFPSPFFVLLPTDLCHVNEREGKKRKTP